jgi:hypothetical protein
MANIILNINECSPITPIKYGYLYNQYTTSDIRQISSSDSFIVPTINDYIQLFMYMGYSFVEETGVYKNGIGGGIRDTIFWNPPNTGATNSSGFSLRAGGGREFWFDQKDDYGGLWTIDSYVVWYDQQDDSLLSYADLSADKYFGTSIRLVNNSTLLLNGETGTYTGNDGKVYPTICIGTQEWISVNLAETKYRNEDWITGFDGGVYTLINNTTWVDLITEAMCVYEDNLGNV